MDHNWETPIDENDKELTDYSVRRKSNGKIVLRKRTRTVEEPEQEFKKVPFIIFEESSEKEIKEFIDAIEDSYKESILFIDNCSEFAKGAFEQYYKSRIKHDNDFKIGMFYKSFGSMMAGRYQVRNVSNA
jgi:hypothetical protein